MESEIEKNKDKKKIKLDNHIIIDDDGFCETSLKRNSPLNIYFHNLIENHKTNIKMQFDKTESLVKNFFFCPQMFNILLDYTYVLPLWSGIMLNYWGCQNKGPRSRIHKY